MDALFDRFARIPILQKALGFIVVCLALSAAFYFLFYSPLEEQATGVSGEIQALRGGLAEKKKLVADLAQYKRDVEKLNQDLQKAIKLLPNRTEIPSLLQKISSLAGKSGLEILKFQPSPEIPQDFYAKVPVSLELEGSYTDVTGFFDAIGKLSRIVNVSNLSFSIGGGSQEIKDALAKKVLKVSCVATTFRFLQVADDSKVDEKAKPKAKVEDKDKANPAAPAAPAKAAEPAKDAKANP